MTRTARSCIVTIRRDEPLPVSRYSPAIAPLDERERRLHAPDEHVLVLDDTGTVVGRCSCWWTSVQPQAGRRVGVIGHYAAADAAAAGALLDHACARLRVARCTAAIGPMDGNTWRSYRLVSERGEEPPFFLEPWAPQEYLAQWHAAGFRPVATYSSALCEDLAVADTRVKRAAARLADAGVSIRGLNAARPDDDLRRIFALSLASFRHSFLFAPIGEAEFVAQYRRLLPVVRPELVLLAEREGHGGLCGFLFAVPDVLQPGRGVALDTVIVKTVAVAPGSGCAGLGSVLVARVHELARGLGFRRAIHALMYDGNVSRNISRRYARRVRRYALLTRPLAS